jgi:Domain of unknown function (DUF5664)
MQMSDHVTRMTDVLAQATKTQTAKDLEAKASGMFVASTGGLRDNKGKPKLSSVPSSLDIAVAKVIFKSSTEGGGKYPMHNWRKGLPWTGVADSALRHIRDFLDGKDLDKESGLHTLYHATTNLAFLIEYLETHPEMDDRYKPEQK